MTLALHVLNRVHCACTALLLCMASWAQGETFPSRPVTLIVPWPAGGAADFAARSLSKELAPILGQSVIVENLPGAGGSMGIGKALKAPPDGYTLMLTSQLDLVLAPQAFAAAGYRPEDARAIGLLGHTDLMLVTRKDLGVESLNDLVMLMKARSDQPLTQCIMGSGTLDDLLSQRFQALAGASLLKIPYNGAGQCLTDLGASRVDLAILPMAGAFPGLVDKGLAKALVSLGEARNPRFPNLPLARDTRGFEKLSLSLRAGLHVNAKVSDEIAQRLHQAVQAAVAKPDLRKNLESTGATVYGPMTLVQVQDAYEAEVKQLRGTH